MRKQFLAILLVISLFCSFLTGCGAAPNAQKAAQKAAKYYGTPVMGLEDSLLAVCFAQEENGYDGWQEAYLSNVAEQVSACGGVLSQTKATDYTQVILGVTAAGGNAQNVAGYDLTVFLSDLEAVQRQGLNAVFWALTALDSGNYEIPENPNGVTATREDYLSAILQQQLPDGGFTLGGDCGDTDMTAMALQALAPYQDRAEIASAMGQALACLSSLQLEDGGFSSWGTVNAESCAQAILALCRLGIPLDDSRFVKNGHTILDKLLTYQQRNGSFAHSEGGDTDRLATLQGFHALSAIGKQGGLFDFSS